MRIKPAILGWNIAGFFWSLFMGVTAVSIGFGALFPRMNLLAKPFVCPQGQMQFRQDVSNPYPGATYVQAEWTCVDDQTGASTPLDIFPLSLYSGFFYGLLIFLVVVIIEAAYTSRRGTSWILQDGSASSGGGAEHTSRADWSEALPLSDGRPRTSGSSVARMKQLNQLLSSNLITQEEYDQKRAEILRNV